MPVASATDLARMRDQLFFEGPQLRRRLSRYWLLLVLAAVIAVAGVVADSTATVIGAMIVAPLMVPILGTVVAVVIADRENAVRCLALVATGAAAVVAIGFVVGVLIDQPVVAATSSQVATRIHPRLIDLIAALATGAVGAVALARDDVSDTLPGVAIAISLVPPLAVVGLTLEAGAGDEALGALLLFTTNVSAILTTGLVVMALYRVSRLVEASSGARRMVHRRRAVVAIVASLVVVSVPLALTSVSIATTWSAEATTSDLARAWAEQNGWEVTEVTADVDGVVVRATGPLPEPDTTSLRAELAEADLAGQSVRLELVPSRTVELTGGG